MKISDEVLAKWTHTENTWRLTLADVSRELLIRRRAMSYTGKMECFPDSGADFDEAERGLIAEGVLKNDI